MCAHVRAFVHTLYFFFLMTSTIKHHHSPEQMKWTLRCMMLIKVLIVI